MTATRICVRAQEFHDHLERVVHDRDRPHEDAEHDRERRRENEPLGERDERHADLARDLAVREALEERDDDLRRRRHVSRQPAEPREDLDDDGDADDEREAGQDLLDDSGRWCGACGYGSRSDQGNRPMGIRCIEIRVKQIFRKGDHPCRDVLPQGDRADRTRDQHEYCLIPLG
jgi:hypothetical protein